MADLTDILGKSSDDTICEPAHLVSDSLKRMLRSLNWVPSDRDPGLHCSEMHGFCPRKKLFGLLDPLDGVGDVDALTMARFNFGTALHSLYQNRYLGPSGLLLGRWRCKRCGREVGGAEREQWSPMPKGPCPDCFKTKACDCVWPEKSVVEKHCQLCPQGDYWRYVELPVVEKEDGEVLYIGHTDGVLATNPHSLLELKSAGPKSYQFLKKPYDSHVLQANLYMRPLRLTQARIVYIDKGNEDPNLVKEFVIRYDEALVERTLALIRQYRAAEKSKKFPPRLLGCDTRNCPWASRCFDDVYVDELIEEWSGVQEG